jgi:hypothetical protein
MFLCCWAGWHYCCTPEAYWSWGLDYLTQLFNLSISNADLPAIWKAAVIVPILKPGKPATEGSSYQPISLLSPCVKILESLLLPDVTAALPKHDSQYGFAQDHSCTTLLPIVTSLSLPNAPLSVCWISAKLLMHWTTPFSLRWSLIHPFIRTLSDG